MSKPSKCTRPLSLIIIPQVLQVRKIFRKLINLQEKLFHKRFGISISKLDVLHFQTHSLGTFYFNIRLLGKIILTSLEVRTCLDKNLPSERIRRRIYSGHLLRSRNFTQLEFFVWNTPKICFTAQNL